jgi:hypothetical protein
MVDISYPYAVYEAAGCNEEREKRVWLRPLHFKVDATFCQK